MRGWRSEQAKECGTLKTSLVETNKLHPLHCEKGGMLFYVYYTQGSRFSRHSLAQIWDLYSRFAMFENIYFYSAETKTHRFPKCH